MTAAFNQITDETGIWPFSPSKEYSFLKIDRNKANTVNRFLPSEVFERNGL